MVAKVCGDHSMLFSEHFLSTFLITSPNSSLNSYLNIAFAKGGAHLPIAYALRLLSTQE